jgi:hypothetical protein
MPLRPLVRAAPFFRVDRVLGVGFLLLLPPLVACVAQWGTVLAGRMLLSLSRGHIPHRSYFAARRVSPGGPAGCGLVTSEANARGGGRSRVPRLGLLPSGLTAELGQAAA